MNRKPRVLIVDDEDELRELIIFFLMDFLDADFTEKANGKDAVEYLNRAIATGEPPDLCISDMNMPHGNGEFLYKFIRTHLPNLPFILSTSDDIRDFPQFRSEYSDYIQKPYDEEAMKQTVTKLLPPNLTIAEQPQEYLGITLEMLKSLTQIDCILYLKLSETNFIKVILPGTKFDDNTFADYKAKKVSHLFVKKTEYLKLIEAFSERVNTNLLLTNFNTTTFEQLEFAEKSLDVLNETAKTFGWSKEIEDFAKTHIAVVVQFIKSQKQLSSFLSELRNTKSNFLVSHSLLISFITTALLKNTGAKDDDIFYLILAAFFHDISLDANLCKNEPNLLASAKLNRCSNKEEKLILLSHPKVSVEITNRLSFFPVTAKKIIVQHHERPDGSGYPNELCSTDLSPLSAVFIIAEELAFKILSQNQFSELKNEWQSIASKYDVDPFKTYFEIVKNWIDRD